jgi:hypothetical protein
VREGESVVKRIIIPAVLFAVILLGGSGCMRKNPTQNINAVALAYMEQRYGEKFEYVAPYGDSMTGTHQLLVKCDSFPEQSILVRVENYRREDKVFLDNYLAVKYREKTVEFLTGCATQVFGDSNVFYDVELQTLSPDLSKDASFSEFLADTSVPLNVMIEVRANNLGSDDQARQIADLIAANGTRFIMHIVSLSDTDYGIYDEDALEQQISLGNYAKCAIITKIASDIRVRWLGKE